MTEQTAERTNRPETERSPTKTSYTCAFETTEETPRSFFSVAMGLAVLSSTPPPPSPYLQHVNLNPSSASTRDSGFPPLQYTSITTIPVTRKKNLDLLTSVLFRREPAVRGPLLAVHEARVAPGCVCRLDLHRHHRGEGFSEVPCRR